MIVISIDISAINEYILSILNASSSRYRFQKIIFDRAIHFTLIVPEMETYSKKWPNENVDEISLSLV